ncbi:MAG: hypothetical protein HY725_13860 [Candidatus Rokubacteria bacterium]|nr:hypothetical protein [Candidatus Rokubacteria bacterium]
MAPGRRVVVDLMDLLVQAELKQALGASGCPICRVGEEAASRYLRFVLHESVNDPATRRRLASSWGFCRRHGWYFLRLECVTMRDGLGTAILAEGLLKMAEQVLDGHLAGPPGGVRKQRAARARLEKLVRSLTPRGQCPPCVVQAEHEAYALAVLGTVLQVEAWRERFALSDGFCLRHLRDALATEKIPDRLRWIVEDHHRRLRRLLADLEEYIRKHDYRFSQEPYGRERDAVDRATAALVGNWFDLPRRPPGNHGSEAERVQAEEGKHGG